MLVQQSSNMYHPWLQFLWLLMGMRQKLHLLCLPSIRNVRCGNMYHPFKPSPLLKFQIWIFFQAQNSLLLVFHVNCPLALVLMHCLLVMGHVNCLLVMVQVQKSGKGTSQRLIRSWDWNSKFLNISLLLFTIILPFPFLFSLFFILFHVCVTLAVNNKFYSIFLVYSLSVHNFESSHFPFPLSRLILMLFVNSNGVNLQ